MQELSSCGWPDDPTNAKTRMVIFYALQRWGWGEEKQAQRGAVDKDFHGIPFTCWMRVLAAAVAKGSAAPD